MVNRLGMLRRLDPRSHDWVVAIGAVAVALGVKFALGPITADAPFLLFFGAVIVSAWLGGLWAGVLATALSALVAELSMTPPYWQFDPSLSSWLRIGLFAAEGVFISAAAQTRIPSQIGDRSEALDAVPPHDARPVRISAVVREVMTSLQRDAMTKGVRLETVIDHGIGAIQGDAECPRQVVANLVSNAIRHTPTGGRVCVRVRRRRQDVELSVVDTGQGISEPDLDQLFLALGQDAGSLARARQQVRLHGGDMTAFSAGPGTGATFTVRLRRQIFAPSAHQAVQQLAV